MSSMSFKYFVEFDESGGIKNLYESKDECSSKCEEYIVKLIPINRRVDELVEKAELVAASTKQFCSNLNTHSKKINSDLTKVLKDLNKSRKIR